MLTRAQIENMYRVVLQREPESPEAVDRWLSIDSFAQLFETFMDCDEYRLLQETRVSKVVREKQASLTWPACLVETETNASTMQRLFSHIEQNWTALGETEPYYSVLTTPEYLQSSFGLNTSSFFESGRGDVDRLIAFLKRAGVELPKGSVCFELGCGVGRLTRWLSDLFASVIAVDISKSHLSLAQRHLMNNAPNCDVSFVHLNSPNALGQITSYDFFFSVIVLQHNPPPIMSTILKAALHGLNRGGFAYFQIPTYKLGYSFQCENYLSNLAHGGQMEMHVLPQAEVFRIIDQSGCKMLEMREDDYTGHTDGISNTFLLQKPH